MPAAAMSFHGDPEAVKPCTTNTREWSYTVQHTAIMLGLHSPAHSNYAWLAQSSDSLQTLLQAGVEVLNIQLISKQAAHAP